MIANMIQVQFSKANNAPLAAALSVTSLLIVGIISLLFVFLNRKYLRNY
jgi:spermidine/putrescine transport system permease protein